MEQKRIMSNSINRRKFLRNSAAIGAGLFLAPKTLSADDSSKKKDDIHVALLGAGEQGANRLMSQCMKMGKNSGIKFRAVCDIWEKGNLRRTSSILNKYKAYGHKGTAYVDYKEMLDTEKDLDAVIVATPDFWHSEQTVACLKAGLHVYCEKEMSNTLEGARKMLETAKATGKLLQIGHQRRSNPQYQYCYEKIIKEIKLLGRITTVNGQWNRSKASSEDFGWPEGTEIDDATLNKYGFKSMNQFRNWRWYKGLGGGPIVDLGSHQIDIYSWFLDALPTSVIASGGTDYFTDHEWYDNVMAIYEFATKEGPVRAFYQTLTTSSSNGYFETFMGDEGTLVTSEKSTRSCVYREAYLEEDAWDKWVKEGYISKAEVVKEEKEEEDAVLDVTETPPPPKYNFPIGMDQLYHTPHLKNFFAAIRGEEKLNCPAEIGYETAVMVLKVNDAVAAERKLEFKPEDFKV
jgi:predicted dehydrogenase